MKRIGILTFWNIPNYGSFLQAYALRNVIEKNIENTKVDQIAYLDEIHFNQYYGLVPKGYSHAIINPRFYKKFIKRLLNVKEIMQQKKKFCSYYQGIENTGKLTKTELEITSFDTIILGSDIIWDYSISFFNHDVYLFGNELNADRIISYAASFGTVKCGDDYPEYVKNGIMRQSAISVRDENSANIVMSIVGKKPEVVIDPTFLWDFKNDQNIKTEKKYEKYIVVYGSVFLQKLVMEAQLYAKQHDLKLICLDSLDDIFSWCDLTIKQKDMTPYEWCTFFKNAEIVFTCTYHGLMFGLIFNKRIVFSPTKFILDKASSFIHYLELENVLVNYEEFKKKADWIWDYSIINSRLEELKTKSLNYLKQAIRQEGNNNEY